LPFPLRFMIDKDILGMGWIRLDPRRVTVRARDKQTSQCQIELDIDECGVAACSESRPEYNEIAPLRLLSLDIECSAKKGFPTADKYAFFLTRDR